MLIYLSTANLAAGSSIVLKMTVLPKHIFGLSGNGARASGCAGTSVGSASDQIGPLQVPGDMQKKPECGFQ